MIYEFAIEPAVVARWHDPREYAFFREALGLEKRRLVSAYPKNRWRALVWSEFRQGPSGLDQNAEKRLDALLQYLWENAIKRKSSFEQLPTWLERAEHEHEERPFWAILSTGNPRNHQAVIIVESILLTDHDLWMVPELSTIKRRADDLADAVAPMLRIAEIIVFVDPYFNPSERRFSDSIEAFCERLRKNIHGMQDIAIELHTGIERFFGRNESRTEADEERVCHNLRQQCEAALPGLLPEGMKISVFMWKNKPRGEELHNRYILCDPVGVLFGKGLDDEDTQDAERYGGQEEDITILSGPQNTQHRNQYCLHGAFELVGDVFEIIGQKRD